MIARKTFSELVLLISFLFPSPFSLLYLRFCPYIQSFVKQDAQNANIEILGVPNKYVHLIGNCDYGRTFFGIDCKGIVESVRKKMEL